jgi:hypothetical protein
MMMLKLNIDDESSSLYLSYANDLENVFCIISIGIVVCMPVTQTFFETEICNKFLLSNFASYLKTLIFDENGVDFCVCLRDSRERSRVE